MNAKIIHDQRTYLLQFPLMPYSFSFTPHLRHECDIMLKYPKLSSSVWRLVGLSTTFPHIQSNGQYITIFQGKQEIFEVLLKTQMVALSF